MFFLFIPKNVDILSNFGRMRFKLEDKMKSIEEYNRENNWLCSSMRKREMTPNYKLQKKPITKLPKRAKTLIDQTVVEARKGRSDYEFGDFLPIPKTSRQRLEEYILNLINRTRR